ncbi:hypothetical protein EZS27_023365 [termite gut metagenome]|uniref:Uncharacterized protein n=1 Tax=termite gut metagenome TaxID=433724 RepID=A0A5J4R2W4_9ZZZZ
MKSELDMYVVNKVKAKRIEMKLSQEAKSKVIRNRILEILEHSEVDIDTTVSVCESDLSELLSDLQITNFDFGKVAGLRKEINYTGYKIVYKDAKIMKIKEDTFDIDKVKKEY